MSDANIHLGPIWTVREATGNSEHELRDFELIGAKIREAPILSIHPTRVAAEAAARARRQRGGALSDRVWTMEPIPGYASCFLAGRPWFKGRWTQVYVAPFIEEPYVTEVNGRGPIIERSTFVGVKVGDDFVQKMSTFTEAMKQMRQESQRESIITEAMERSMMRRDFNFTFISEA